MKRLTFFNKANDNEEQASPLVKMRQQSIFFRNLNWRLTEESKDQELESGIFRIFGTFEKYYSLHEVLGEGTSGTVKRAVSLTDGKEYAAKITNFRGDEETVVLVNINEKFILITTQI